MHNIRIQIVPTWELDMQKIVADKKYDKFLKKFLTNSFDSDILNKLSARNADNDKEFLDN